MRARKPEEIFDFYLVRNILVRIDVPCIEAEATRVLDIVRSSFPYVEQLTGFSPDEYDATALDAPGKVTALALTCEENEHLPLQVMHLRDALEGFKVTVRAIDLNPDKGWQYTWKPEDTLPSDDEWCG